MKLTHGRMISLLAYEEREMKYRRAITAVCYA
jgi:hypothetical protein